MEQREQHDQHGQQPEDDPPQDQEQPQATRGLLLRSTTIANRYFWKQSLAEQLSQTVYDKNPDYIRRTLPGNEVTVLALNEIAFGHGRGLFYHLPSREIWKSPADEGRIPKERVPPLPLYALDPRQVEPTSLLM